MSVKLISSEIKLCVLWQDAMPGHVTPSQQLQQTECLSSTYHV